MEKKAEVAMEMSDLVVYCQPRSKEKDRFGKHMQMLVMNTDLWTQATWLCDPGPEKLYQSGNMLQHKLSLLSVLSFKGG